jgi:hypothetical protein
MDFLGGAKITQSRHIMRNLFLNLPYKDNWS